MKKTILILLLCHQMAHAQNADTERTHTIKLDNYSFDPLPAPVKSVNILVSLWDSTRLGFVQVGLANKKFKAQPAADYTSWLQAYVTNQYGAAYNASGKELLLVIKDLRINERTWSTKERAFVRLLADAYSASDNNQYQYLCSVDTVLDKGGMDVTKKHGKHIAETVHLLLTKALTQNAGSTTLTTFNDIQTKTVGRFSMPILTNTQYTKGVYLNYEEFKNNTPSISEFSMRKVKDNVKLFQTVDGQEKEITSFWGLSQNNELYKWHVNHLVAIEQVDHAFIISSYLDAINRRNKSIFWGAIAGGMVGAAIANSSSANHVCVVKAFPYLSKNPEASSLDMDLGEFTF